APFRISGLRQVGPRRYPNPSLECANQRVSLSNSMLGGARRPNSRDCRLLWLNSPKHEPSPFHINTLTSKPVVQPSFCHYTVRRTIAPPGAVLLRLGGKLCINDTFYLRKGHRDLACDLPAQELRQRGVFAHIRAFLTS